MFSAAFAAFAAFFPYIPPPLCFSLFYCLYRWDRCLRKMAQNAVLLGKDAAETRRKCKKTRRRRGGDKKTRRMSLRRPLETSFIVIVSPRFKAQRPQTSPDAVPVGLLHILEFVPNEGQDIHRFHLIAPVR